MRAAPWPKAIGFAQTTAFGALHLPWLCPAVPWLWLTAWPLIRFATTERVCALLTMCCMGTALM